MKKTLLVLIVLMAAVAVAQAQVIQMKLGHFAAESHPGNLAVKMFIEAVENTDKRNDQDRQLPQQRPGIATRGARAEHPGCGGHEPAYAGTAWQVL